MMTDWSIIQSFFADRQDKMLGHLIRRIQERGDMDTNDEETRHMKYSGRYARKHFRQNTKFLMQDFQAVWSPFRPIISYQEQERGEL